jgi:hypothetical protein
MHGLRVKYNSVGCCKQHWFAEVEVWVRIQNFSLKVNLATKLIFFIKK